MPCNARKPSLSVPCRDRTADGCHCPWTLRFRRHKQQGDLNEFLGLSYEARLTHSFLLMSSTWRHDLERQVNATRIKATLEPATVATEEFRGVIPQVVPVVLKHDPETRRLVKYPVREPRSAHGMQWQWGAQRSNRETQRVGGSQGSCHRVSILPRCHKRQQAKVLASICHSDVTCTVARIIRLEKKTGTKKRRSRDVRVLRSREGSAASTFTSGNTVCLFPPQRCRPGAIHYARTEFGGGG